MMKYNWKVLVLEDDAGERKLLSIVLKDFFLAEHIVLCENFDQAAQEVKTRQFDLFLVDLAIPDKTGMDFIIDVLQKDKKHQNTPIIVISATSPESLLAHTVQPICFDFIYKPFTYDRLEQSLEKVNQFLEKDNIPET